MKRTVTLVNQANGAAAAAYTKKTAPPALRGKANETTPQQHHPGDGGSRQPAPHPKAGEVHRQECRDQRSGPEPVDQPSVTENRLEQQYAQIHQVGIRLPADRLAVALHQLRLYSFTAPAQPKAWPSSRR